MKRLLPLLLSCFLLFESVAQNGDVQKFNYDALDRFITDQNNKQRSATANDSNIVLQNLGFLKGRKPGVYRLPQDNMPCIVPDSTQSVKSPNISEGSKR